MSVSEIISVISALLFGTGLFVIFSAKAKDKEYERELLKGTLKKAEHLAVEQSLKDRVLELQGKQKQNLIKTAFQTKGSFLPPLLGLAGLAGGYLFLGSLFVAVPLAVLCYMIPTWVRMIRSYGSGEKEDLEIEAALSIITSSYMKNSDLVGAIQDNISYIRPPVRQYFMDFLAQYRYTDASIPACLQTLRSKFNNRTAKQWCDFAMEAQNTATVKYAMQSSLNDFRMLREVRGEYNLSLRQSMKDFRTIVLIIAAFIPALYLYSSEWFSVLTGTFGGKLMLSILVTVMLFGVNKSVELQAPLTNDKEVK